MFQSAFGESVAVKEGKRPTIELKEDDAGAMDTILRVLHYKSDNLPDDLGPMTIALVAIHADKYQLQGPLKPWVSVWFHERGLDEESPQDYYLMLLAAWAFRLNDPFANTSRKAIKDMKPGFTGVPETVELPIKLPLYVISSVLSNPLRSLRVGQLNTDDTFAATIDSGIKSLRDRLDAQIQFVERKLAASSQGQLPHTGLRLRRLLRHLLGLRYRVPRWCRTTSQDV